MRERSRELERLISSLTDGDLSDAEFCRLDSLLASDSDARAIYHTQVQLHTLLLFDNAAPTTSESLPQSTEAFLRYVEQASGLGNPGIRAPQIPVVLQRQRLYKPFFLLKALPTLAVVFVMLLAVIYVIPHKTFTPPDVAGKSSTPSIAAPKPSVIPVQLGASSLRLDSGTATLMIANVGHVIVEGPAQFDLLSAMRARLEYGRIKVRVTEPTGHGFLVETPDGDVTDLGTEFALDVAKGKNTELVVFEGAVDLRMSSSKSIDPHYKERLFGGDGIEFNKNGMLNRIVSIMRSDTQTFNRTDSNLMGPQAVISGVTDNLRSHETKRFYEIVPGGLGEDALAYVDRLGHDWNGLTEKGMPAYLVGADYIKPFCGYKLRSDVELEVTIAKPARLFVFFDNRLPKPEWLTRQFRNTGDKIGLDCGAWHGAPHRRGIGPGISVDHPFSIWEKIVLTPGIEKLGSNVSPTQEELRNARTPGAAYGIAAVPLEPNEFSSTP